VFLTGNKIFALFDCLIKVLCDAGHAICLESDSGFQIMVHIAVDTFKI
jgi:phosphotransferase system IIA component